MVKQRISEESFVKVSGEAILRSHTCVSLGLNHPFCASRGFLCVLFLFAYLARGNSARCLPYISAADP
jgi:hypothetical protein